MPAELGLGTATLIPGYGIGQGGLMYPGLIRRAVESGIRYIDTAAEYADSEVILGGLADLQSSLRIRICSKLGVRLETFTFEQFANRLDATLSRLSLTCIDTLLLHSAGEDVLSSPEVIEAAERVRDSGKALRTGASTYGSAAARRALGSSWCDVVQIEYSILNQSVLPELLPLKRSRKEIVVRSVLCKGLLSSRRANVPSLTQEIEPRLEELEKLAESWRYALPELAIRFAMDAPGVDVVLVGISSQEELQTALAAYRRPPLHEEQMSRLAAFDLSDLDCVHPERWTAPS